ncbi:hypothetical protein [Candidatus Deferrimicrobium sp.]|uniref:hypothetical protein n=1 Tax=Candidatus Deferrimicrobium sp. TaxID=3060586 RepID=UPI003C6A4ACC
MAGGAIIGEIVIRNENIFDTADPREDNWLFRLANKLHVKTRPWVIRGQLLFRTGDRFDRRLLEESERILRSNSYFYDVWIRPIAFHDGRVDVEVVTRDVWTLKPGFSFGRSGGANSISIKFEDSNFLGWGVGLGISRASTPDRNTSTVFVQSGHIAGTRIRTELLFSQNSDGRTRGALIERPFYALDTHWAAGANFMDNVSVNSLERTVKFADRFQAHAIKENAWVGWSEGLKGRWVKRYTLGFTRDVSLFSAAPGEVPSGPLPPDRTLAYPWVGFGLLENAFEKARNRDKIERTEDFFLGTRVHASLGYANTVFGADRSAAVFSGGYGTGFHLAESSSLLIDSAANGRYEAGSVRDAILGARSLSYVRLSENWLAFSSLSANWGIRLDPDHELLLGGENGLRGYPRNYQAGDRSALFTLEGRYYTELYPFRLFRIGGAAFYDMGRAWGGAFANPDPGVLRDIGTGLRIALARSGQGGIIHIDVAFPLDGDPSISRVQYLVRTKAGF